MRTPTITAQTPVGGLRMKRMPAKLRVRAAPATLVSLAAILAPAVAGPVAVTGAEAAGQGQPQCGDKITADTTLHEDLVNCRHNGIRIGADNITLDLNGHLIDGDGTSESDKRDIGVANEHGDGVTVMHGSIRQFDGGVNLGNVRHNRMLGISTFSNTFVGIALFGSDRSLVRDNSANGSTKQGEDIGVGLVGAHHVRVLHNSLRDNSETGIWVTGNGRRNLVRGNHIRGAGKDGVLVDANARHTLLKGNRASGAKDDGFDVKSRTTKLTGNRAVRNHDLGIHAVRGVIDGGGNVAHGNGDRRQCTHVACS
jgi:parallel beta-helix repeat protein